MAAIHETWIERHFMSKVIWNGDEDECWIWEGARKHNGYGRYAILGHSVPAHRLAYELFVGRIPAGMLIDHTCHNGSDCFHAHDCLHRACVNPLHLEPVTHGENVRRGMVSKVNGAINRAKTHCPKGHPYTGDNLYINPRGSRNCRTCRREIARFERKRN